MDTIQLRGGQCHLTQDEKQFYQVVEGEVLVYLLPYKEKKPGRRLFIYQAKQGEKIPALCWSNEQLGQWIFGLVALDSAVLQPYQTQNRQEMEEIYIQFCRCAGIKLLEPSAFEEQMVEQYNLNMVKEEVYLYASTQEQQSTYHKTVGMILELFHQSELGHIEESGNRVYDAAAFLCRKLKISIASFDAVRDCCGRRFDLKGIARVSHFSCREVQLEKGWYRQDGGSLLAYTKERGIPVVCLPKGPGKYYAYNLVEGSKVKIDATYAETLEDRAEMVYCPFPPKKMNVWSLIQFGFSQTYLRDWVSSWFLALVAVFIGLLFPTMNQLIYDRLIPLHSGNSIVQICLVLLGAVFGNFLFTIVKNFTAFRGTSTMRYAVQNAVYDRMFRLPESFLSRYDSADLAQRAIGITILFEKVAEVYSGFFLTAIFSFFYFAKMVQFSPELSGIALAMMLVFLLLFVLLGIGQMKYEQKMSELDSKTSSIMYQFMNSISKIRIAGVENRAIREYLEPYTQLKRIGMKKQTLFIAAQTLKGSAQAVFLLVIYGVLSQKPMADVSVGAFVGFTTAFGAVSGALLELATALVKMTEVIPLYQRSKPLLDTLPEGESEKWTPKEMPGNLTGDIEVNNLQFSYGNGEEQVLKGISFHIRPGEYVGIVGASGSGKSTLMKLLLGFEQAQNGRIYYDGRDIDGLDKRELRKKFGVVLQDGKLIAGSIYENITIMAPGTPVELVQKTLRDVDLEEDIARMPMGLHTILDESSRTISGGQRQRILIARAILAKPKILYFDEATSALDNVAQAVICKSLEKLRATRIVVAHRLSTVEKCDRILVLDEGKIVEEGNYQQLMEKKGCFYEMAQRQVV